ncbi:hypothetical protein WISP_81752 [Willisornis vidua]|uniref:Major facilitator superfamily (MFS) profile domain-containing protein n=1 Tax=Willisornis vidua TaxID=1566151 RepID=A0ABQ9DAA5_9PASS|nr:hypothetical protein WISP_81752 [Willisornis vidua]
MAGFLFVLRALVSANFNTIYIYTAEVYPTTMRALGMGTSGSLCRVGAMVAPFISQVLMSASFIGALCLFSSVCVVCAISAVTLPIETKGRALQVCIPNPGTPVYLNAIYRLVDDESFRIQTEFS